MSEQEDQYWEKIDDFLDGKLSTSDKQDFAAQLEQEEQLQKDVRLQKQLRQGVAFGSQLDLRSRLAGIQQEYEAEQAPEAKVVPLKRAMWTRYAAAAAMLVGALTILFLIQSPPSSTELFASNYEPYSLKSTTRSPGQDDAVNLAVQAYEAGDYDSAITRLKAALETDPRQAPLQLALAISLWESGQQAEAMAALEPIMDHPILQDQANWYAGLFNLASDDMEAAKQHLQVVVNSGGALGKAAADLLETIE